MPGARECTSSSAQTATFSTKRTTRRRLIDSGLNSLIVSLDGTTQETYERYRVGGSLEKVLAGVRNVVKARDAAGKRLPRIYFQFVVMSHNEHQIDDAKKLTKQYGVDKNILLKKPRSPIMKTPACFRTMNGTGSMKSKMTDCGFKGAVPNKCMRLWTGSVVTWDGPAPPLLFR